MVGISVEQVHAGDYVKLRSNHYIEVQSVYGILPSGRLRKPSEGFFGVIAIDGRTISGWDILGYLKRDELPEGAVVEKGMAGSTERRR